MKVKTSDLTGMALCYAVCMIEMPHLVWGETIGVHHASNQIVVPELKAPDCYSPFTDWRAVGPLIEREEITFWTGDSYQDEHGNFTAIKSAKHPASAQHFEGPTPLIAAMRCYVTSKMGDEVEVPDELV